MSPPSHQAKAETNAAFPCRASPSNFWAIVGISSRQFDQLLSSAFQNLSRIGSCLSGHGFSRAGIVKVPTGFSR